MATKTELGPDPKDLGIPGEFIRFSELVSKVCEHFPKLSSAFVNWFLASTRDRGPNELRFVSMTIPVEEINNSTHFHTAWYVDTEGMDEYIAKLEEDELFLNQDGEAISKRLTENQ